jgi:hypothetical protein
MMAWHSDFSEASFCVQNFQNPDTGMSAIFVYIQVHRSFDVCIALSTPMAGQQFSK